MILEAFFFDRVIRGGRDALRAAGGGRKQTRSAENCSPRTKICGFDVTEPEKVDFDLASQEEVAFLVLGTCYCEF
jgi:hypothetical protein